MNILVTGANGQLGSSLRKIAPRYDAYRFVFTDIPEIDITDGTSVSALIEKESIDLIINCAAYTAVDRAEEDIQTARKVNVEGPAVLAHVTKAHEIRLIHVSTDYVFNGESYHPLHEDHPVDPQGVYGVTKLEGEKAILQSGCKATIIRTAWLYSEFGANFVKTMCRVGAERNSLQVVYDQIGTPTYATDLAHAILAVAEKGLEGYEVYHYSNEGAISWYDFAKAIFELSGMNVEVLPIESNAYPTAAKRPAYSVLSKKKIKTLGIDVPYWRDSLKTCLKLL